MVGCCEGCEYEIDGHPNYGEHPCIVCSEYEYDSQYTPKKLKSKPTPEEPRKPDPDGDWDSHWGEPDPEEMEEES